VLCALAGGASYATFGPVHDTPSKRGLGGPVGVESLRAAAAVGLPLVALGGMTPERAREAFAAGARGVAAIRGWLEAPDPAAAVAAFLAAAEP
jgi:thiamine-phosphate pyrophosphorylase